MHTCVKGPAFATLIESGNETILRRDLKFSISIPAKKKKRDCACADVLYALFAMGMNKKTKVRRRIDDSPLSGVGGGVFRTRNGSPCLTDYCFFLWPMDDAFSQ